MQSTEPLSAKQVADRYGVSEPTVIDWARTAVLPPSFTVPKKKSKNPPKSKAGKWEDGNVPMWHLSDIEKFEKDRSDLAAIRLLISPSDRARKAMRKVFVELGRSPFGEVELWRSVVTETVCDCFRIYAALPRGGDKASLKSWTINDRKIRSVASEAAAIMTGVHWEHLCRAARVDPDYIDRILADYKLPNPRAIGLVEFSIGASIK